MAGYSHPEVKTVSVDSDQLLDLAQAVLGRGALFTFEARGLSMRPFIRWGDRLTIAPCRGSDLQRGEVAFYVGEDRRLAAHRVLGKSPDGSMIYTRGDGVWRLTPETVRAGDVLGRVVRAERRRRRYRPSAWPARLVSRLWHGLYPYPLRAYLRLSAWRQARRRAQR